MTAVPNLLERLSSIFFILQAENSTTPRKCNPIKPAKNTTFVKHIGGFESLSESLIVNLVCFFLLTTIYSILSKKARDAPGSRDVNSLESNWIQLFYGDANASQCAHHADCIQDDLPEHLGKGYLFWLRAILKIREEHVLLRCGIDAYRYVKFQRHILSFVLFASIVGLFVLVPVNFQGTLEPDHNYFSRSSMVNLHPRSPYLWVHPFIAVLYIVVCMSFMWKISSATEVDIYENFDKRTLMITNIPRSQRQRRYIRSYFKSLYPMIMLEDIKFAYDVRKLMQMDFERECVESAINWCEKTIEETGNRPTMKPVHCGYCFNQFCCCCCCNCLTKVDSLAFYTQRRNKLIQQIIEEKRKALANPLEMVFVTFRVHQFVNMILANNQLRHIQRYQRDSNQNAWKLKRAPASRDIYWENLAVSKTTWIIHSFLVNSTLFIFVFFLTTPHTVFSALGLYESISFLTVKGSFLSEYIPTLTLLCISLAMPLIVAYSDIFMNYSTRSIENLSMLIKAFVFLVLMVIILPCLELTSVSTFLRKMAMPEKALFRWECVFLPDNGIFFTTYLMVSGFIGTSVQLIRIPELVAYSALLLISRSRAESVAVRKAFIWEFEFGVHYAFYLLNVAIIITFCISAPIITPFGLFYLSLKFLVDRYNLYFVYSPSKMSKSVHTTAINIVLFCFAMQQLLLLLFSYIRNGFDNIWLVYFLGFILTLMLFLVQLYLPYFHWLQWLALPHIKKVMKERQSAVARDIALLEAESGEEDGASPIPESDLHYPYSDATIAEEDTLVYDIYAPEVLRRDLTF